MPTFDTPEPILARINSRSGSVTVTAQDTTTTQVDISGDDNPRSAPHVDFHNNLLRIDAGRSGSWGHSSHSDFDVVLPANSAVQIETSSGDVICRGRFDEVRVNTASGSVDIDTANGPVRIETASGDVSLDQAHAQVFIGAASGGIRLGDALGEDPVEITTASGDMEVGAVHGPLKIGGASGDIRIEEVRRDVTANTVSGDISLDRVNTGAVTIGSHSGDVGVRVRAGIPTWLDLNSLSGDITTDQADDNGPGQGEETLELRVTTFSGDIRISRRA